MLTSLCRLVSPIEILVRQVATLACTMSIACPTSGCWNQHNLKCGVKTNGQMAKKTQHAHDGQRNQSLRDGVANIESHVLAAEVQHKRWKECSATYPHSVRFLRPSCGSVCGSSIHQLFQNTKTILEASPSILREPIKNKMLNFFS